MDNQPPPAKPPGALRRFWLNLMHQDPPVDVADPLGGALKDAELLIAYAAQSRRSIDPKKALALAESAALIKALRERQTVIAASDSAKFWEAYDAFAVAIAPLSAHSIRSSLRVNGMRFPWSLITPTAINALLAATVFYVFLSLQSFWVAGKEMNERADNLEREKTELTLKLAKNRVDIERTKQRHWARGRDRCEASGECNESRRTPVVAGRSTAKSPNTPAAASASVLATLDAEIRLLDDQWQEQQRLQQELVEQRDALAFRSRPLENLMASWHERAQSVCGTEVNLLLISFKPMAFICSLKQPDEQKKSAEQKEAVKSQTQSQQAQRIEQLRTELTTLRQQAEERHRDRIAVLERSAAQTAGAPDVKATGRLPNERAAMGYRMIDPRREAEELRQSRMRELRQELSDSDADRFSRVTTEVRMIVANLGTYLIALVMGLLGALTYILRTLSQQLREHTYVPVSISESVVRIYLGAIAGVFGSLLAPTAGAELKSLPPIFIPFVFGYGIEILFSMLDRLVRSFTQSDTTSGTGGVRT